MSQNNGVVLIYCPCGSEEEAVRIARGLLDRRLIACANVHESRSLYFWKGELADEKEHILICKTTSSRTDAAERAIRDMHSYELPCIMRLEPAKVNDDYAKWVFGEVAGQRSGSA